MRVIRELTGGLSNKIELIEHPEYGRVVRKTKTGNDKFIIKRVYTESVKSIRRASYGPVVYHEDDDTCIEEFIESEPCRELVDLSMDEVARVVSEIKKFHSIKTDSIELVVFTYIEYYLDLASGCFPLGSEYLKSLNERDVIDKKNLLKNHHDDSEIRFSHNDLLNLNILIDDTRILFIDYEYAGTNNLYFDIADFINEFAGPKYDISWIPDPEQRIEILSRYLDREPDDKEVADLEAWFRIPDLLWGVWACLKSLEPNDTGYDYLGYGRKRLDRYLLEHP